MGSDIGAVITAALAGTLPPAIARDLHAALTAAALHLDRHRALGEAYRYLNPDGTLTRWAVARRIVADLPRVNRFRPGRELTAYESALQTIAKSGARSAYRLNEELADIAGAAAMEIRVKCRTH